MDETKLAEELRKMEQEPLLPVEKTLIRWSLVLGLVSDRHSRLDQQHVLSRLNRLLRSDVMAS